MRVNAVVFRGVGEVPFAVSMGYFAVDHQRVRHKKPFRQALEVPTAQVAGKHANVEWCVVGEQWDAFVLRHSDRGCDVRQGLGGFLSVLLKERVGETIDFTGRRVHSVVWIDEPFGYRVTLEAGVRISQYKRCRHDGVVAFGTRGFRVESKQPRITQQSVVVLCWGGGYGR